MKLKKIASLALAGVMAVSMLAGCKTATPNDGAASSEETATATGYSAMLADEMKDLAGKKYVSFKDNASDLSALKFAVTSVAYDMITDSLSAGGQTVASPVGNGVYRLYSTRTMGTAFKDKSETDEIYNGSDEAFASTAAKAHLNGTFSWGILYQADGTINMETVMAAVATDLKAKGVNVDAGTAMTETAVATGTSGSSTYDLSYVVSVSVVNVPNTTDLTKNESVNVIAVTVTRTGVDD